LAIPRLRPYTGPAILSYGFRPFFLLGSVYAALAILFWLPAYAGQVETFSAFAPVDWHIHEMLFGYLTAIVAGFLLTAIPNWTGRLPVLGLPLLGLVVFWVVGRFAVFFLRRSDGWPPRQSTFRFSPLWLPRQHGRLSSGGTGAT
jgi:uncharacterized protein involved in response to NO